MWWLYTMAIYSAIIKNENLSFAGKLVELQTIILSDASQAQKAKNHRLYNHIDYRPKKNALILLDMGHTLRGECAWEE
jgi:hypothetical protein